MAQQRQPITVHFAVPHGHKFRTRMWTFARPKRPKGSTSMTESFVATSYPYLFQSFRPIEEHIRPSADHFLSMTFPSCGRAFFLPGIRTADKTIAFGKKSFVYFVSLAASFVCFRIIASATFAISSRCAPCLH